MIRHRGHVGWEVTCDATGCPATTASAAPDRFRRLEALAVEAAQRMGWLSVRIGGQPRWVCPIHQEWDPRLHRWVATPLAVLL